MSENKVQRNSEFIPVPGFWFQTPVIKKKRYNNWVRTLEIPTIQQFKSENGNVDGQLIFLQKGSFVCYPCGKVSLWSLDKMLLNIRIWMKTAQNKYCLFPNAFSISCQNLTSSHLRNVFILYSHYLSCSTRRGGLVFKKEKDV